MGEADASSGKKPTLSKLQAGLSGEDNLSF